MNGMVRTIIYLVGLAFLVIAAWIILTSPELEGVIPQAIVAAILILIVGLGLMGLAYSGLFEDRREHMVVRETESDESGTRVRRRTIDE